MRRLLSVLVPILLLSALPVRAEWTADAETCYAEKGDVAIRACDRALASGKLSREQQASTFYNRGNAHGSKGDRDLAIRDYDEAIRLNSEFASAFFNRGNAYYAQKSYDRAIRDYDEAIRLKPDHAAALLGRGNIHHSKGSYDRAIQDYDEAIRVKPDYAIAYGNRGRSYWQKGDLDRARRDLRESMRRDGSNDYNKQSLASVEAEIARRDGSGEAGLIRRAQQALNDLGYDAGPVDGVTGRRTRDALGAFRRDQGLAGGGEVDVAVVAKLEGVVQARAEAERRRLAEAERQRQAEAERQQRLAVAEAAQRAAAEAERQRLAAEQARQSVPALARACANDSGEAALAACEDLLAKADLPLAEKARAHLLRGNLYRQQQRPVEAIGDYDVAIGLQPGYVVAFLNRGAVHLEQGDLAAAARDYRRAIELEPGDSVAKARLAAIEPRLAAERERAEAADRAEAERRQQAEAARRAELERQQQAELERQQAELERQRLAEEQRRLAERDTTPPVLETAERLAVESDAAIVEGRVSDDRPGVLLTLDGEAVAVAADGSFRHEVYARLGESHYVLEARDAAGNLQKIEIVVGRSEPAPVLRLTRLNPLRARWAPRPETAALVIGIEQYDRLPAVPFAQADAKLFFDYAQRALGVPRAAIELLDEPGETRRNDLLAALRLRLLPRIRAGARDVVIYYAGHGLAGPDGRLYLLPRDALPDPALLEETALAQEALRDELLAAGARSVLFLLDTCFGGAGRDVAELAPGLRATLLPVLEEPPARVTILAAAAGTEPASALPEMRQGAFSYFAMQGLEGAADGDGDGVLTAGELQAYLQANLPLAVATLGRRQTPTLVGDPGTVLARR